MLQRGRPPTRVGDELGCEQGTTSAGHQARRSDEGGRDGGWRLRMAAVAYCEAADRVVNSASPRARLRRGHSTRSWHVIDGIIVNQCVASSQRRVRQQDAYRVFPRDPHAMGLGTAEAAAGLAGMLCGGRGKLGLIQCIPRTVRNDAHLTTFPTGQSLQGQPPP